MSHSPPPGPVRWLPEQRWLQGEIAPAWRDWLADRGSLTRRLIDASGNRFSVRVIDQSYRRVRPDERLALNLPPARVALIREVVLCGAGRPWVYARSVLPLATLSGRLRALRHLDNRPLGALLFTDPGMSREGIEIAKVPCRFIPGDLAGGEPWLWGRRSVFYLDGKALLVAEIFLPDFSPYTIDT